MINPEDVRDGVTKQCTDSGHVYNGLMCVCYCHDQDQARWRDQMRATPRPPTSAATQPLPTLTGADLVRRLFGPAVLGGNLEAAKAEAERVLGDHERQVREQVAREIASFRFPVGEGPFSEVPVAIRSNPQPTVHVPDAAGLRGRIIQLIAETYQDPHERASIAQVALGNEIWHTVVAHLAEHGVELGLPRQVEQSVRWKQENR